VKGHFNASPFTYRESLTELMKERFTEFRAPFSLPIQLPRVARPLTGEFVSKYENGIDGEYAKNGLNQRLIRSYQSAFYPSQGDISQPSEKKNNHPVCRRIVGKTCSILSFASIPFLERALYFWIKSLRIAMPPSHKKVKITSPAVLEILSLLFFFFFFFSQEGK